MSTDPTVTNPGLYSVVLENERVRVLETAPATELEPGLVRTLSLGRAATG